MDCEMYERNLPPYLAHDLEAWKKGVEEGLRHPGWAVFGKLSDFLP